MATIAERIKLKQAEVKKLQDDLLVASKALDEAADPAGEEAALATMEQLTGQLNAATKALSSLENAEKALMQRAVDPQEGEDGNGDPQAPPVSKAHGSPAQAPAFNQGGGKKSASPLWLRMATCAFLSHVEKKAYDEVMGERYKGQKDLETVRQVQKSQVLPANTYTAGWAAELVQNDVRGFLQLLATTSMAAALATRSFQQSFDGFGSVSIPFRKARAAATNDMGGAFVGEGGAIPLGRIDIGSNKMERYKLGVISTFTKELQERSTPSIEALLREAILEDTSIRLDGVVFGSGAAVAGVQPAGLFNGVTPITGATGGGPDAVIADLKALAQALAPAGKVASIVVFMNDQDALSLGLMQNALGEIMFTTVDQGRVLSFNIVVSENQPKGTIKGLVAANIATAFDLPEFDVNDVATIVEANADATPPTMANGGASGAVGTANQVPRNGGIMVEGTTGAAAAGYTARSLWQTYSTGIRTIVPASWGMIRAGSAASVDNLSW
jgi:HK97 family phage major capsid protein